jgi:predicted dehydrogenase
MNTATDKVPAAIIGLGWWGRKIAELVQTRSDRLRFIRAVEPNVAAVSDIADKLGVQLLASYDAVLADPAVEAVVLATPHTCTNLRLSGQRRPASIYFARSRWL